MYEALFWILSATIVSGIVLHAALMRVIPVGQIYVAAILVLNAVFAFLTGLAMFLSDVSLDFEALVLGVIFLELFSLTYVLVLVGVANDSPTLAIVKLLMSKGDDGVGEPDIQAFISSHPFLSSRLEGLKTGGGLETRDGQTLITGKAHIIVAILRLYKRLARNNRDFG